MSSYRDRIFADAGALAFFSLMALAPFSFAMHWVVEVAGLQARQAILDQAEAVVAKQSVSVLGMFFEQTHAALFHGPWAPLLSFVLVLLSAMMIFAHIHQVLNKIWHVAPKKRVAWWRILRKPLVPLTMMLAACGILLLSVFVSAVMTILANSIGVQWRTLEFAATFGVATTAFFLLFKWFPDTVVAWRPAVIGGIVAAFLFEIGKFSLEKYLALSGLLSWYGTSGPLVALLMWVYYSSLIVFFGAETVKAISQPGEGMSRVREQELPPGA